MLRKAIVEEARSWLGTKWMHQGRVKKNKAFSGGVDCAGLIIEVGNRLALFTSPLSYHHYNRLPHDNTLLALCNAYLVQKPMHEMLPGDILVFRIHVEPQHLAIAGEKDTLIHAYLPKRSVIEQRFCAEWQSRLVAVYRYPRVMDTLNDSA